MAYAEQVGKNWRGRYRRPDRSLGSTEMFPTKRQALTAARDEESRIRHNIWTDPRIAETTFGVFAKEWYEVRGPRLAPTTAAKYRSYLNNQILPKWRNWPLITIFNSHLEIEKWVTELHEGHTESSVAAYFALFSTIMNAAVRARMIPANPCVGVQVTSGDTEADKLIATPEQGLRAAMRLYETAGLSGFVLCLMDLFTGARWGELVGQTVDEYDADRGAIPVHLPLKEVGGRLFKGGTDVTSYTSPAVAATHRRRTRKRGEGAKTKASERWVTLPPSIAVFYELLIDSHDHEFVFTAPEGGQLYRGHFRARFWRKAWDGTDPDNPQSETHTPPILRWFTFHEGRHTHETWLVEDDVPEVARRARLGHKMKGIARVYEHVTPAMEAKLLDTLEARWDAALLALDADERAKLIGWFPHLEEVYQDLKTLAV